jgi:uncharacterized protein (DUF1697 family)
MPRYVAFLRGVSPMNAKMPELKRSFEAAGFSDVKTVLSSGNVVFSTRRTSEVAIQRRAETAMQEQLGKSFFTILRRASVLQALLESDPFAGFELPAASKRVVTFLRSEPSEVEIELPLELDGASIFAVADREIFAACVPGPRGSAFMASIEKAFGKNVTTRTLETIRKCALA